MQLTPEQLEVVAGIIVSIMVTGLLKRWWPNYVVSPKLVKVATVTLTAFLTVLASKGFHLSGDDWQQILSAAIGALGTYGLWAAARDDVQTTRIKAGESRG